MMADEWLANTGEFKLDKDRHGDVAAADVAGPLPQRNCTALVALKNTWLKKSEVLSRLLPSAEKLAVAAGSRIALVPRAPPTTGHESEYWLVRCAEPGCGVGNELGDRTVAQGAGHVQWWDGTFCDS